MHAAIRISLVVAVVLVSATTPAQQSVEFEGYEVHYNSINTNLLEPDVASVYEIQRSGTRAMLNITVLDKQTREAVEARVTATATNLTGQRREIDLRQINDQGAIYYIGQFRIHDEETLNFNIEVVPAGHAGAPLTMSFRQQFFTG